MKFNFSVKETNVNDFIHASSTSSMSESAAPADAPPPRHSASKSKAVNFKASSRVTDYLTKKTCAVADGRRCEKKLLEGARGSCATFM